MLAGIDYGSKLAGTTVLATLDGKTVQCLQSAKKRDADAFLLDALPQFPLTIVGIDAPLSLPGIYRYGAPFEDYFYREADRALSAMSPMFLGGLTARAMRLRNQLNLPKTEVIETYPGALARKLGLKSHQYKQKMADLPPFLAWWLPQLPFQVDPKMVTSWHHVDAILALFSTWRYQNGQAEIFGQPEEGQIIV